MNHMPSDHLVSEPPMAVGLATTRSRTLVWAAWLATLALSNLPLVIARDVLGTDIPWMTPIWLATAALLLGATYAMYKWDHALYTDAVLSAAAREAYFAPPVRMEEGMSSAYGWQIMDTPEHTLAVHGGEINGFLTFVIRDPATQLYVIVLSNVENPAAVDVAQGLAAIAYGEPYDMPEQPPAVEVVEVDPAVLQKCAGSYQFSADTDMTLTITAEAGHLFVQVPDQPKIEFFPTSETEFFAKIVDIKLHFEVGADGAVTELVIHEGGQENHAAKVQ